MALLGDSSDLVDSGVSEWSGIEESYSIGVELVE